MTTTTKTQRLVRSLLAVSASVGLALSLAACSGGDANGVKNDVLGEGAQQTYEDWNYEFEKCMKEAGIDMSEGIPMDMSGGSWTPDSGYQAAESSCLDKVGQAPALPNALTDDELQSEMLAFAKCMRDLGYDVPDPEFSSGESPSVQSFDPDTVSPEDLETCMTKAYPSLSGADATHSEVSE